MTKLDDVFMLSLTDRLNFETIAKISSHGFSRIPIYDCQKSNIVGLVHVKDLTLLSPEDNMPVSTILKHNNHKIVWCDAEEMIDKMFEEFRMGNTHMAFVTDVVNGEHNTDPYITCVGIITLEDILEELVQMEIYDELDFNNQIKIEKRQKQEHMKRRDSRASRITNVEIKRSESNH